MNADEHEKRDRAAEAWLHARHASNDWHIGQATMAEWRSAYRAVDADDLELFLRDQAEKDPAFAASFLNRQGESLLRLWLEAWENGGTYPVEGTRIALREHDAALGDPGEAKEPQ